MIQNLKRLVGIERKRYAKKGAANIAIGLGLLFGIMGFAYSVSK